MLEQPYSMLVKHDGRAIGLKVETIADVDGREEVLLRGMAGFSMNEIPVSSPWKLDRAHLRIEFALLDQIARYLH